MRYDDYNDYNSRSSRGNSRRGSSSYSSGRDYDRDYDRDYYRGRDRDYRGDYGREYDRDYYQRDRYNDRYSTRSGRDWYDDFDRSDWERTAPDWEDHGGSRKKRTSSSGSGRSGGRSSQGGSRGSSRGGSGGRSGGSRPPQNGSRGGRRPSDGRRGGQNQRRSSNNQRKALQILPIVVGLVVIILAALVIRSMLEGKGDYEIKFSTQSIVVGETATATLEGVESGAAEPAVEWTSKDNNVVSVEGTGVTCTLTAKSLGSATIVAAIDGETVATNTVQVVSTAPGVQEIRVTQDSVTIRSGETYTIDATVVMESDEYSTPSIKWSSNDTSVAKVSEDGVITAQDVGKAIIKGVAGEKTVEIAVEVVENPNSTPHDSTQDAGQSPEDGADTTTDGTGTGTGTGTDTDTGTGTGTGSGTGTGTGTGTDSGSTGTGTDTGTTGTGTTETDSEQ